MLVRRIAGATRVLGREQGYLPLPVLDAEVEDSVTGPGTPVVMTAWGPTPLELAALQGGASLIVQLVGREHPPIMLFVADDAGEPVDLDDRLARIAAVAPAGEELLASLSEDDLRTALRVIRSVVDDVEALR